MCLVVLAWAPASGTPLVLVGHRDEFHDRAAAPMHWWSDPPLLAGRDLVAGGTWLGIAADGRFGVVTNLRGARSPLQAPSRGTLIPRYLDGSATPAEFLATLSVEAHRYAGFSLVLGDRNGVCYYSNGEGHGIQRLGAGIYGLSNGPLDADWPKVRRARARLAQRLARPLGEPDELLTLLADRDAAPDDQLPDTGVGLELERQLSPLFIVGERYGTRAASAVVLATDHATVIERSHGADGAATGTCRFRVELVASGSGVR